ncbi:MAG TPA: ADOP family duplicated permease [Gemmatimonadales bacterium]|nr:ADOP family duplicated permease [Gemmatimonadales bacterium]
MDALSQDLRVALRRIQRAPALATAIVLTIGLGLGAAAAIFTASDAALVEPLPYARPERLVHVWELRSGTDERGPTSYPTLLEWRSRAQSFSALEAYDPTNITVGLRDEARMLRGAQVTAGFFRLLGVRISAGRDFLQGEDATTGAGVAIVSDRVARSVAGGIALDQTIVINGTRYPIVGVLPRAFHFALLQDADIFVPLIAGEQARADRSQRSIYVIGRLRDGVALPAARAELSAAMSALASEHPDALAGRTVVAVPLRDALLGNMQPILASLLVAVAILLVIMGANLALLMLTRYIERAPELAMRSALGATRARVLRQLLVESLVPSVFGAAVAMVAGQMATRGLLAAIPDGVRINMPYLTNAGLDGRVIGVMVGVTIVLAVGFGLGPALLITQGRRRAGDVRTTLTRSDRRLRRGLVAAQLALTVVLLVSSGLLVVSFSNLVHRDVGFRDAEGLVTARAPLSGRRYEGPVAQRQFYEALLARSAALPGVRGAALINEAPGGGGGITTFEPVDRPLPRSMQPRAILRIVGGEYFSTLGIPVVRGRAFESHDRTDTPPVAVVSASFARLLGQEGATVGRRVRLAATGQAEWEVVGVVGDVQVATLDADSPPVVYLSHLQAADNRMTLVLRTELGIASIANQVRAIVKTLDAGVPVYAVTTLAQQMNDSKAVFSRRFPMMLCGVFAAAALALTLVALYAVCMHDVLTRRREFGVRLAVGGSPGSIRRLILREVLLLGATGIGLGAIVAAVVSRSMRAVLFGVAATDWRVYGAVAAGVLAAAVLATLGPALRAGAVHPSVVMRVE